MKLSNTWLVYIYLKGSSINFRWHFIYASLWLIINTFGCNFPFHDWLKILRIKELELSLWWYSIEFDYPFYLPFRILILHRTLNILNLNMISKQPIDIWFYMQHDTDDTRWGMWLPICKNRFAFTINYMYV